MSRHPVTILTCEQCSTELRVRGEDPAYIAGWSSACGWYEIEGRDYCPDCVVKWDRDAFDDLLGSVLADRAAR